MKEVQTKRQDADHKPNANTGARFAGVLLSVVLLAQPMVSQAKESNELTNQLGGIEELRISSSVTRAFNTGLAPAGLATTSSSATGSEGGQVGEALPVAATDNVRIKKSYPMGINKYALDHETELTGWKVSDKWFFGRARGEDSGLALVWQRASNQQMSLSSDGIRYTRRF